MWCIVHQQHVLLGRQAQHLAREAAAPRPDRRVGARAPRSEVARAPRASACGSALRSVSRSTAGSAAGRSLCTGSLLHATRRVRSDSWRATTASTLRVASAGRIERPLQPPGRRNVVGSAVRQVAAGQETTAAAAQTTAAVRPRAVHGTIGEALGLPLRLTPPLQRRTRKAFKQQSPLVGTAARRYESAMLSVSGHWSVSLFIGTVARQVVSLLENPRLDRRQR